ncbi:MAG: RHS repeat-associated core domain-containing protein, partial [Pseudomonadota bacterium]
MSPTKRLSWLSSLLVLSALLFCSASALCAVTSYEYDRTGRLTRAVYESGTQIRYVYDPNGNLLQRIIEPAPVPDAGPMDGAVAPDGTIADGHVGVDSATGQDGGAAIDSSTATDGATPSDSATASDSSVASDAFAHVDAGQSDTTAPTTDSGKKKDPPEENDGCGCFSSARPGSGLGRGIGLLALFGLLRFRRRKLATARRPGGRVTARLFTFLVVIGAVSLSPQLLKASTVCLEGTCDYTSIHQAIRNANDGETVTVSPGVYLESNVGGSISCPSRITLRSKQSDPTGTVIDAEGNGTVLHMNCIGVLDGFTIRNGRSAAGWNGGGILYTSGVQTIKNCIIENNVAERGGGGLFTQTGSSTLILINTIVRNNQALDGSGGGIWSSSGAVHLLAGTRIENNSATKSIGTCTGGGVSANTGLLVEDSYVTGNTVRSPGASGAGIATGSSLSSGIIRNSTISNNVATPTSATGGSHGAGLHIGAGSWLIEASFFFGNRAVGGVSHRGGAIEISTRRADINPVRLRGVSITANEAIQGGGVYCGAAERLVEASDQVTNNSLDDYNNCGVCNSGAVPAEEQSCSTGLQGVCASGRQTCINPGVWSECVPDVTPGERDEICDNFDDDDCDGKTDAEDEHCQPATRTTNADHPSCGNSNEPVNTFTGELYDSYAPDIHLGGPLPVYFARYYSSGMAAAGITGRLGDNWRHNYEWSLDISGTTGHVTDNQGHTISFEQVATDWVLQGVGHTPFQLLAAGGDHLFGDPRSGLVYTFDSLGQLTSVEDGKGNVLTLTHSAGDLIEVADGLGRALTLVYGANTRLSEVSDGTRTVSFGYTGDDLTSVIGLMTQTTNYDYAAGGLLTSWTLPEGNAPYSQTFDGSGRVDSQSDAYNNTHTFAFDEVNNLTTMTDPMGDTREHVHTNLGELASLTGKDAISYDMGYDSGSRRNAITDRLGDTTHYDYHPESGKLASVTNADGTETRYSFLQRSVRGIVFYDLSRTIYPDGTSDRYGYDPFGNLVSHVDRAGNERRKTYNPNGQLLSSTNAAGGTTTLTYNADGTVATSTDPAGNTTSFTYDALMRLSQIEYADTTTRQLTYDDADRIESVADGRGNVAAYIYDNNGNLVGMTDRSSQTTVFVYDQQDRLINVMDPIGNAVSRTYDHLERLATTTDQRDNTTIYSYDKRDRLVSVTDASGQVWSRTYDLESILTSTSDPLANTTTFVSDNMGRITRSTSPLGHSNEVAYDGMGRVASATNALGEVTAFSYDDLGLLTSIDIEGVSASYSHNALGKLTAVVDPIGSSWTRSHDNMGRLSSRTDPLGNSSGYAYDVMGRMAQVTLPGGLGTIDFAYDDNGNNIERAYTGGLTLSASYDEKDRLTSADGMTLSYDDNDAIVESNGLIMTRDASSRIETVTFGVGKVLTYRYNSRGQLSEVEDWLGGISTFAYDAAGRLTTMTRPNGITATYTWDSDSRLVGIDEGSVSSIALVRDAAGQITSADRNMPQVGDAELATAVTQSFDVASQVATSTYDALGRLLDDGVRTYVWDLASRLLSYTEGGNTVSFTYDGAGMRTSRTEGGVTRDYAWNHALGLSSVAIERESAADLRYYVHTPSGSLLYSVEADGSRRFFHFDEMGNTSYLTDDVGATIASYDYSPYGEVIGRSGVLDNDFTWQGQHGVAQEGSGGLYYLRARYYHAPSARFISRDALSTTGPRTVNRYQYAVGNPLGGSDPTGLFGETFFRPMFVPLDFVYDLTHGRYLRDGEAYQHRRKNANKYFLINNKYADYKPGHWRDRPSSPTPKRRGEEVLGTDHPIYSALKHEGAFLRTGYDDG